MSTGLNKQQQEAVDHPSGPLLMAAGAGSGKTKALTTRLKELIRRGTPAEQIIAITFTNKAAKEMRERVFGRDAAEPAWNATLPAHGVPFIGTFHSLGAKILKQELRYTNRKPGFSIFDDDDSLSLIKKICKELNISQEMMRPPLVAGRISAIKSELMDSRELMHSRDSRDHKLYQIYLLYEEALAKNNGFDFDDLIEKPVRILLEHPEALAYYQTKFSQLLVDEYQDINTSQYRLVRLLAGRHQNITVVGDDAQAIYAFRGADFRNFLNFKRDWPDATIIKLEQNYRSTKNIISAASAVIKHNKLQTPKTLWTENPEGHKVRLVAAEDADTESRWIAEEIYAIKTSDPGASIGIIYRTNAQSRALEQALISSNYSYKIFGGLKFYDRKEVKDIIAALRLAVNPSDSLSIDRLEKSLGKRGSKALLAQIPGLSASMSSTELIKFFMETTHYQELLETKFDNPAERLENIAELVAFASTFSSLPEFLERASLLQSADAPQGKTTDPESLKNPVNLMSIHIAKGLEFDYVFVVGTNEGTLPHEKSLQREEDIEEERRLMYVAMTRARKGLYIVFHAFPSRFIYEIPSELCEFISPSGRLDNLPSEDDMWLEA